MKSMKCVEMCFSMRFWKQFAGQLNFRWYQTILCTFVVQKDHLVMVIFIVYYFGNTHGHIHSHSEKTIVSMMMITVSINQFYFLAKGEFKWFKGI